VLKRPQPHPLLHALRLGTTTLLALHVFVSAWLVATVDAAYTEGPPSPTEIHSLVAIDKDQTAVDVNIERATSLVLYTLARDKGVTAPSDNASQDDDSGAERASTVDWLFLGRGGVMVTLTLMVVAEGLVIAGVRYAGRLRFGAYMLLLLSVFILFPMSYVLDVQANTSAAQNSPGFDLEDTSFVHTETTSSTSLIWLGFQVEGGFSGYDLGMVEPANRTNVSQTPPREGTPDANSWVVFESTFTIAYGKNLDALFFVPLLWLLLPAGTMKQPLHGEEE
jgi:hypothetical protein